MTLEEELLYLDQQINETSETLNALKKRRKEVEQLKEQQNLQMIYERIQASGKTIDEVLSYLAE